MIKNEAELLNFRNEVCKNISLVDIKIQKGVIEKLGLIHDYNLTNVINEIKKIAKNNNNIILLKQITFNFSEQECDEIIFQLLNADLNKSWIKEKFMSKNFNHFHFINAILDEIEKILKILKTNSDKKKLYENINETSLTDLRIKLANIAKLFTNNLEKNIEIWFNNFKNSIDNNQFDEKKYNKTKVYEIFNKNIKYI